MDVLCNTMPVPTPFVKMERTIVENCYLFCKAGQHILYSPLDKLLLVLDSEVVTSLQENQTEPHWKQLVDPDGVYGLFEGESPSVDAYITEGAYDGLVLLMNNLCNMGCTYCYAKDAQKQETETFQRQLWVDTIGYAFSNLKSGTQEFSVAFHGYGECTVEFHKIKEIAELVEARAREFGITPLFSITTNGTFSEEDCKWMIDRGFRFNISLDGNKMVNDQTRLAAGGRSLHETVERNVSQIADAPQCKMHIRATVTRGNVENMEESLRYFHSLGAKSVQFEPITPRGAAIDLGPHGACDIADFTANFKNCIILASELGIALRYGPLNFGLAVRFCSSQSKLTVDYKGRILSCLQAAPNSGLDFFQFGTIGGKGNVHVSDEKLDEINSFSVYDNVSCKTCLLKFHCAGDCKAQDMDLAKFPSFKKGKCSHNEDLFAWCLNELLTGNRAQSILDFELEEV